MCRYKCAFPPAPVHNLLSLSLPACWALPLGQVRESTQPDESNGTLCMAPSEHNPICSTLHQRAPKNWCFRTVMLENTLESPMDCKEIKPVHSKGDQSWIFIGRTDAEAEAPIPWPLDVKSWIIGKDSDLGKIESRRRGKQRMRWLDGITNSMDMSLNKLWEMVKDRETWLQRVGHNWATEQHQRRVYVSKPPLRGTPELLCAPLKGFLKLQSHLVSSGTLGMTHTSIIKSEANDTVRGNLSHIFPTFRLRHI